MEKIRRRRRKIADPEPKDDLVEGSNLRLKPDQFHFYPNLPHYPLCISMLLYGGILKIEHHHRCCLYPKKFVYESTILRITLAALEPLLLPHLDTLNLHLTP